MCVTHAEVDPDVQGSTFVFIFLKLMYTALELCFRFLQGRRGGRPSVGVIHVLLPILQYVNLPLRPLLQFHLASSALFYFLEAMRALLQGSRIL